MDQKLAQEVVEYIGCTAAALEQATKTAAAHDSERQQVAERVPGLVRLLQQHGYIDSTLEKDAAEVLQDPVRALELLKRVIEKRGQAPAIGAPTGDPITGAHSSLTSPFVGARSSQPRESDQVWLRGLGLTS